MLNRALLFFFVLSLAACSSSDSLPVNTTSGLSADAQYLVDSAARDDVTVTASGLQYEVLRDSDGSMPGAENQVVTLHYVGTLVDGTEFDSSVRRGRPSTFNLGGTIPGFAEGVQLMSVGSQYRFVIPADLAYADRGAGELIGPDATLIFEVELLEINSN